MAVAEEHYVRRRTSFDPLSVRAPQSGYWRLCLPGLVGAGELGCGGIVVRNERVCGMTGHGAGQCRA